MEIKELKKRPHFNEDKKLADSYSQFDRFLGELKKRDLPEDIVNSINRNIDEINAVSETDKWGKQLKKTQSCLIKKMEKETKLVPKHYYRNTWLAVGMATFGIPLGLVFGISLGNMAFLAIGLPIGMGIGIAVGTAMDKKALEEGRQLDLEIKY